MSPGLLQDGVSDCTTKAAVVHSLSTRAAIPPDVPARIETLLLPQLPDFLGGDTLVVTIIPLSDVLGDFDLRLAG